MAIEIASRLLAVIVAVAFTLVFASGRLPVIPRGRWTVVALFALGLAMCTLAGTRDGLGTTLAAPYWLTSTLAAFGIAATLTLIAVLVGLDWRLGVIGLGIAFAASWTVTLTYAIYAHLESAQLGVVTLVIAAAAAFAVWRLPHARLSSPMRPSH
jgi:hypothetical protein